MEYVQGSNEARSIYADRRTMQFLLRVISVLWLSWAFAPAVHAEDVSKCFIVHGMSKNDDVRYLVDAVSRCAQEYDAVYVMVSFLDGAGRFLGNGVWPVYWCRPGRREFHEFSVPRTATGYERVVLRRITTDFREALQ